MEAALGLRDSVPVFGNDDPTPDGICFCDHVHVSDLTEAHVLALRYLLAAGGNGRSSKRGSGLVPPGSKPLRDIRKEVFRPSA
jgi:UDP-glucose 4-epimerase